MKYVFTALLFMLLLSCKHTTPVKTTDKNRDYAFLAEYYGESYDSIANNIVFEDSNVVITANLRFSHFYDRRNVRRGADGFPCFNACKYGILVTDISNSNSFVYSKSYCGDISEKDNNYYPHATYPERRFKYSDFFSHADPSDSFAIYYKQQTGVSLKLSAILNSLSVNTRLRLTRKVLDSCFQDFFFLPYEKINASNYNIHLISAADTDYFKYCSTCIIVYSNPKPELGFHNDKNKSDSTCTSFFRYIRRNVSSNSMFVYDLPSIFSNGSDLIITINEDIKTANEFYKLYDNEPILYNIKIYSPFRFM